MGAGLSALPLPTKTYGKPTPAIRWCKTTFPILRACAAVANRAPET